MDLLDEFAARAMQAVLATQRQEYDCLKTEEIANIAYDNAEAMIKEKQRRVKTKTIDHSEGGVKGLRMQDLKIGDKVRFVGVGDMGKINNEKGIVEGLIGSTRVYVVYNCNKDWENYSDYSSQITSLEDLRLGWV
jgi:hypothetical protein